MSLITVIGRGHSGTRAISQTLTHSGVYMGARLNDSGDLIPAERLYDACQIVARNVRYKGDLNWDSSALHTMPIDDAFTQDVEAYLRSVLKSDVTHRGWKLPETTLVYPWIVRMFPDNKYIHWVRDPRDCICKAHQTDDLDRFGVPYAKSDETRRRRAISWKYQIQIVNNTPRPKHFMTVRFEDFVLHQDKTLARLEAFLGFSLAKIDVLTEPVGRWKTDPDQCHFDFLEEEMVQYNYL